MIKNFPKCWHCDALKLIWHLLQILYHSIDVKFWNSIDLSVSDLVEECGVWAAAVKYFLFLQLTMFLGDKKTMGWHFLQSIKLIVLKQFRIYRGRDPDLSSGLRRCARVFLYRVLMSRWLIVDQRNFGKEQWLTALDNKLAAAPLRAPGETDNNMSFDCSFLHLLNVDTMEIMRNIDSVNFPG